MEKNEIIDFETVVDLEITGSNGQVLPYIDNNK